MPLIDIVLATAVASAAPPPTPPAPTIVRFDSDGHTLGGELYVPEGAGPFPALLWNHGSAPGMYNAEASRAIGPRFARAGWIFFMPWRRGQGPSADAGPYIGDVLAAARRRGGAAEASAELARQLAGDHLRDQLAAFAWLEARADVDARRIAVAGNSFGGIEAILGGAHAPACAVVAASAGSESWGDAPDVQRLMTDAARAASAPMLLFQAANDADTSPARELQRARQAAGRAVAVKTYPAYGTSARDGHAFAWRGVETWFPDVRAFVEANCPP